MKIEGLRVATEAKARELLAAGYQMEIRCITSATQSRNGTWNGLWKIDVVGEDGLDRLVVVTHRQARSAVNDVVPREFKTLNGLVSFMFGMGVDINVLPLKEGKVAANSLREHR